MRKKVILILFILLFGMTSMDVHAYAYKNEKESILGGTYDDSWNDVAVVPDGFIAVGTTSSVDFPNLASKGKKDAIFAKFDKNGNILWQKSWGGSEDDEFLGVIGETDGSFIVVGATSSNDAGFTFPERFYGDAVIIKYDKNGTIIWQKSYNNDEDNLVTSSQKFTDIYKVSDGYIVVGESGYVTETKMAIVKYNESGERIWKQSISNEKDIHAHDVVEGPDGIYVTGLLITKNVGAWESAFVGKYSKEDGSNIWLKENTKKKFVNFEGMISTTDGVIVVGNIADSINETAWRVTDTQDAYMVKYDTSGNISWEKVWGGKKDDSFEGVTLLNDGTMMVTGVTASDDIGFTISGKNDTFLAQFDLTGKELWKKNFGGDNVDTFRSVVQNGEYLMAVGDRYVSKSLDAYALALQEQVYKNYKITVEEPKNGKVDVASEATNGSKVSLKLVANENYQLKSLKFLRTDTKEDVTSKIDYKDGSFTMPEFDITIVTEFVIANYKISVKTNGNGTIEVIPQSAGGIRVPIKFVPNDRFEIKSFKILRTDTLEDVTSKLEYHDNEFTMPEYDVTLSVEYQLIYEAPKEGEVENPATGATLPISIILVGTAIALLAFYITKRKRIYKL